MSNLQITEKDGVIQVMLSRPEVRNAFNPAMIAEITQKFETISKRNDVRAVVLKGEGKSFCAGADLNWMKEMVQYSLQENKDDSQKLFDMFSSIAQCPHPVVGVVHGAVFGGALGLLACCDMVLAEEKTQFCFSEVKLGLVPAVISHFVLRKSTLGLVSPWMILGRVFGAIEAKTMGLVHITVAESELSSTELNLLKELMDVGPEATRETKKLIQKIPGLEFSQAKAETTEVIAHRRISSEGQEGLKAFLEKRSPSWKVQK